MTEAERVANEDFNIKVGQILYVISDYDNSIIPAQIVKISKPVNEKYFTEKRHDYLVVDTVYLNDNTGGYVTFYPRHFNKCIFLTEEDAQKAAREIDLER